jgi:tetratricopeptide (TPR) repeat protein
MIKMRIIKSSHKSYQKIFVLWFCTVALFSLFGCSGSKPSPEQSIINIIRERASQSEKEDTPQASLKLYSKLLELEPDNIRNHIGFLGAVRKARSRQAFGHYLGAFSTLPAEKKNSDYIVEVVFTMLDFDLSQDAREFVEKNKGILSSKETEFWLSGAIEISAGNLNQAKEKYENCLVLNPTNRPCRYDLNSVNSRIRTN